MRQTVPRVYVPAETRVNRGEMDRFLRDEGIRRDWVGLHSDVEDQDLLIEFGGRLCYGSWEPGYNPNVTKVREDSGDYLDNIKTQRHGSVIEHPSITFLFADISRVFTHELVRHRAGVAISQESLRYVRLTDIGFRIPPALAPYGDKVIHIVEELEEVQRDLAEAAGLDNDGVPFHVKKEVTSALRRLAPLGLSTKIMWTANLRTIRHVVEQRTSAGAEEEIRFVFDKVAEIARQKAPLEFRDYEKQEDGSWTTPHVKV
jgi:thymidylate synthase (FAD)